MKPYYEDNLVTLYHGDCREHTEWLDAAVLVTDPPYGNSHTSNWEGKFRGEVIAGDDSLNSRDDVLAKWGNRPALVFGSWKMPRPLGTHSVLIWDKGEAAGMGDLSVPWKPNYEEVYVIGKGFSGPRTSAILRGHQVVTWASMGRRHPNMKPVTLMGELLKKCPPGVVADPFAGSGSTLVAASHLGRPSIGFEIDESYCEVIAEHFAQRRFEFADLA